MSAAPIFVCLPFGVHISDGVLSPSWLAGGFALSGLLALLAAYRVRDEEVPRIALLSAAFFIASLMHLRLGPTSVHLLLNGLVGVVLGRRAPLAILIGLGLQAALLGHGGFTTIGINACVLTISALLIGWLFALLQRLPWSGGKRRALFWVFGCILGMTSVLATLILQAIVLLWGGAEDWHQIVWLMFYAHLPIVLLEGVVLGFTVSFLARVKPAMLGLGAETLRRWDIREPHVPAPNHDIRAASTETISDPPTEPHSLQAPAPSRPPALLLVFLTLALTTSPARAHRPHAHFELLSDRQVQIDGWFDPGGDPMKGAKVQVFRPGQRLLVEGRLDDNGNFVFRFTQAEPLEVIVSAGAGHRTSFVIPREKLEQGTEAADAESGDQTGAAPATPVRRDHSTPWQEQGKDALIGIGFVLALGAFLLSWRTLRRIKGLEQAIRSR